jgi:multidrug efflux pump subunit AcrA (membrane-fusion protein)
MRFFGRGLTGLFLLAVTLGLLALAGQMLMTAVSDRMAANRPGMPARERIVSANVVTITPGPIVPEMTAYGEVSSRRTLELRAPQGGTITALSDGFQDGAEVTAGQVLLQLDPADATSARDLAAAAVAEAEGEVRDAARALDLARDDLAAAQVQAGLRAQALTRQRDLETRGVGSAAMVETAALAASAADQAVLGKRASLAQAQSRVDQAAVTLARQKIGLADAERRLAETTMKAEISGRLNGVSKIVTGGLVSANERLGEIIDPDALDVAIRLSTAQFSRLLDADGALIPARVTISLDVMGADIGAQGQLRRVGAAADAGAAGRLVYASLDAPRGFRPGDFVTVRITEPVMDGVAMIPAAAVDGAGKLLVLGPEDRLEDVAVQILRRQDDAIIVTADGLAGREVVAERSPLLGAGIRVKPVRQGAPTIEATPALVDLTQERRAELIAFVQAAKGMPEDAKARVLEQLAQDKVPATVIQRIESRMGG